jgi:hypothetical protein
MSEDPYSVQGVLNSEGRQAHIKVQTIRPWGISAAFSPERRQIRTEELLPYRSSPYGAPMSPE